MNRKILSALSGLLFFSASSAFASYTITRTDGRALVLVQGREYQMQVQSSPALFDNVYLVASGALANYDIFVGAGIQVGPNEYKVDSSGSLIFNIRFHSAPGTVNLTVTNKNDSNTFTTVTPTIQRYPTTFQITPALPTINANVPFSVQITPIDALGNFVSAFEDPVQIKDRQLGNITPVSGAAFIAGNGVATVNVTVKAGDMNNKTSLRLDGVNQYFIPNPVAPPTYTTPDLNLVPAAYNKVVMLFPGEILDPGFGKSGAVTTQVANIPVGNVTIWPVDSFFNPIHSTVNLDLAFTSSIGTDVMPANRLMTTPPMQVLGGAFDPFIFINNGTRFITATPNAQGTESDTSQVPVAPGANNTYDFAAQQPVGPYTTDDVITVKITARDPSNNVLTTLFGPLPGASLSARVIGAPTQESAQWVDTNPATLVPDNIVNFSAGVATVNLGVTKRGSQVQLHFQDQFGVGAFSNQFTVNTGALDKIHLTIVGRPTVLVGETFTPGTYPGNSGTPPTIIAGDDLVVEARLTDRHWNIVTGPAIIGLPITLSGIVPTSYITATHPDDPTVTFDISGELRYQGAPFDKSFRVRMRSAGTGRQFRANSSFSVADFVSSTVTISAGAYAKVAFEAPGETLRPGSFYTNGKEGVPSTEGAGLAFPMTVYLTDQYWNPIQSGPYSNVKFSITPGNPFSFISGVTLGSPVAMPASARTFSVNLAENSDMHVEDASNASRFQNVSIPVGPGNVDHFRFTLGNNADKEAGVPFIVTIQAEDQFNSVITGFNNPVILTASTGAGTMSPAQVTLTAGVFNGLITCFGANTAVRVTMTWGGTSSISAPFKVLTNSQGYRRLLLLGPDEVHKPGTAVGKSGANGPKLVGTAITIRALACDLYYNQLTTSNQTVQFASDGYAQFSPNIGDLGLGEFDTTMILKAAVTHTLTLTDLTAGNVSPSTSTIVGKAGTYSRLQILAPGEMPDPGNEATGGKKVGFPPNNQMVSVSTPMIVRAVDNYYNPAVDGSGNPYSGGDILFVSSPTNSLYLPPNNTQNGPTPRPLVNDIHSRDVLFGDQGFYVLKAFDQNDFTKTFGQVTLNVQPGPVYVIQSPASAVAGQNFASVRITLELGGTPVSGYNQSVFISAVLPNGTPATGQFTPDGSEREYVMSNGVVVINDLNYQYVEGIKIKVRDNFNRVSFSNVVDVLPSGLKYDVSVPVTGIVGPPSTFLARIELRDLNTSTLVKSPLYNHTVGLSVVSLLFPSVDGTLSVSSASLVNGVCTVSVAYTKAEAIVIKATNLDLGGFTIVPRNSNAITLSADSYKKLVIIAPGETHTPGVLASVTGKTGTPTSQDRRLQVVFQVRGTDQFWNTATAFNGGKINYSSVDPLAFLNTPVPQDGPLAGGLEASAITFNKAGNIPVVVKDLLDGNILSQEVVVPVVGTYFDITVPANQTTGAPFSMTITLRNNNNNIVPSFGPISIEAVQTDGANAQGILDVKNANLVAGNVTITNQRYTIAEDIRFRVKDQTGENESLSNVVHFIPRAVFYTFENLPTETEVNAPFTFLIQAMDADTGTKVKNFNRSGLPLDAFATVTGNLATGVFVPNSVNIVNGQTNISATYNKAESIYFRLTDNTTIIDPPPVPTQQYYFSGSSVKVKAGAISTVEINDPIEFIAGQSSTQTVRFKDVFGNLIPDQRVSFSADIPDQVKMNNEPNTLTALTDSNGTIFVTFEAMPFGNGDLNVVIHDVDHPDRGFAKNVKVRILGLGRGPRRARPLGGDRIPVGTHYFIDLSNMQTNGGVLSTFYRIDQGAWKPYDANDGASGFDVTKQFSLEWYSTVCYPTVDPTCSAAVSELSVSGGGNLAQITTYIITEHIVGYPSPFNPKSPNGDNFVTIQYPLVTPSTVEIDIYDLFGQKVWHKDIDAGQEGAEARTDNRVFWGGVNDDGNTVANGGYVIVVKVGSSGQRMKTKVLVAK